MKPKPSLLSTLTAVGLILAAGPSLAQTADVTEGSGTTEAGAPAPSGDGTANEGAFQALSPGGQKIARALFDAQKQPATDGAGDTGSTGEASATAGGGGTETTEVAGPRSLDDIAAAKAAGTGWGQVFKEMKAEGLVTEKNLGQVISGANRQNRLGAGDGSTDTGDGIGPDAGTGSGAAATIAATNSKATASRSALPPGHRTKPVTVTLANGATVVVGGHGRGGAPRGDAAADAARSGTNRGDRSGFGAAGGHGHKGAFQAGAAGRDFGALLGNGASAGNFGHGSINSGHGSVTAGSGVSHGGGHGKGINQGSGKGSSR